MPRAKCYDCVHRREVPGSAHSSCHHPATEAVYRDPLAGFVGLMGRRSGVTSMSSQASAALNIRGVELGIRNGWFIWPVNFDPTWLENCDGFMPVAALAKDSV